MPDELTETLRQAQRFGFFGARPIEEAIEHSQQFVAALGDLAPGTRLIDIGSGGGLPGLVLAVAYPHAMITLLDRRQKRTDFLQLAVHRLGWSHVTVAANDVAAQVGDVGAGLTPAFDVVTARGFGPPDVTLSTAADLVDQHGSIVISEPPTGDRWPNQLLAELGLTRQRRGAVSMFTRRSCDCVPVGE